ncbi:unnamed protein product [Paramecium sonneborni]|uniref:BZIP domain-containing protein n=1 Tax=Paramecium sonneborni TaxID=65129 RepID=A0A8S1R165_9CILI|nr:unnamed protein product [Paramecium sonneborni]
MSDFFMPNRSEITQQNQSGLDSLQDILSTSFGRMQQNNQSYGGSFVHNSWFLIQSKQYSSSMGLEDYAVPIQIYEDQEPQIQKADFFRSSGDFEMQFEEIGNERLNIQAKILEDLKELKNPLQNKIMKNIEPSLKEFEIKIESGVQINQKFKPEIEQLVNQNIIQENKNLFNVNQSKSIYVNKIAQLVEKTQKKIDIANKSSTKLSKNQQKFQRKSSMIHRNQNDVTSNEIQSSQISLSGNINLVQQKLAKNRQSAKNSRARKKIYYELLEAKVKELQYEVERLKESNHNESQYYDICNKTQFQLFLDQEKQLFDKLETCLLKNQDNYEIAILLDALRNIIKSNSQERNDATKQYFDSMIEVCLPIQTKYLIYSLDNDKDFFAQSTEDYTDWMKETFYKIQIQPEQILKVKKMKTKLQSARNNISDSIQKINDQLKLIQSEASKVDQIWEQLKECLTPLQLSTCIIAIRQNSIRQELQTSSLFLQLKNCQMSEKNQNYLNPDQSHIPNNRKLIKKSMS